MNNVWTERAKRKWTTYPNYQELSWTDYLLIKQGTKSVKVRLYQQTAFRLTLLRWLFHYIYISEYRLKVTYLHLKLMLKVLQLSNLFKTPVACTWSLPENTPYLLFQSYLLENVLLCSPSIHRENCSEKNFFFQNYITNVVKIDEICQELSTSHFDAITKTGNCLFVTFC